MFPEILPAPRCQLGESPLWDEAGGVLHWCDIEAGRVYAWTAGSARARCLHHGETVGGMVLEAGGGLVLLRRRDVVWLDRKRRVRAIRDFDDAGAVRFNDAIADHRGRVFAGMIGRTRRSGGLVRFDPASRARVLFRGTGCANGMAFSPDGETFYWTCSTKGRIYAFAYAADTGRLSRRRVLCTIDRSEGVPDGLCVDEEGMLWSARWGAGAVVRHSPRDGAVESKIRLPAPFVTSCCFGGADRSTLFVTSAMGHNCRDDKWGGCVFAVATAFRGLPRAAARLCGEKMSGAREAGDAEPESREVEKRQFFGTARVCPNRTLCTMLVR